MLLMKRIQKEISILKQDPLDGIDLLFHEDNLTEWILTLKSSIGFYKGGTFQLSVSFPADYPFKAPTIKFQTKIYHPNVDEKGSICLGILKADQWKPNMQMRAVFQAISHLLQEPNPDDPLDTDIAEVFKNDRPTFEKKAQEMVKNYAM